MILYDVILFSLERFWMVLYVYQEQAASGKCFQENMGLVLLRVIGGFKNGWIVSDVLRDRIRLLEVYDDLRGIGWNWQSLDSVSVKAPLGGT
jgi:hypothetical protein